MAKKTKIFLSLIFFVVVALIGTIIFLAYGESVEVKDAAWQDAESNTIVEGTQGNIGDDLRAGVGNIRKDDYTDSNGEQKRGLVSGLWVSVRSDGSKNQNMTVYAGQTVNIYDNAFYVEKIERSYIGKGSVRLRFRNEKQTRLNDPNLLYASFFSSGLCRNDEGEEGGCYSNAFLYNSGQFIGESGWQGMNGVETKPFVAIQFTKELMDRIKKQIRDSGIMEKSCPDQKIIDASWKYQINLDGTKKTFETSPSEDCKAELAKIDELINYGVKDVSADVHAFELVYSSNNGSLPPQYYRENILTLSQLSSGSVKGELIVKNYQDVLERSNVSISVEQFNKLITDALVLENADDSLAGCTGGTTESIKVLQSGKSILETSNYNCAGKSTNESLKNFSPALKKLMNQ